MKISKFIARLHELWDVVGSDVEVAISLHPQPQYESAEAELSHVTSLPVEDGQSRRWISLPLDNEEEIITIW